MALSIQYVTQNIRYIFVEYKKNTHRVLSFAFFIWASWMTYKYVDVSKTSQVKIDAIREMVKIEYEPRLRISDSLLTEARIKFAESKTQNEFYKKIIETK